VEKWGEKTCPCERKMGNELDLKHNEKGMHGGGGYTKRKRKGDVGQVGQR